MPDKLLPDFIQATAQKYAIPGVAVGMWADGQEIYACYGVTSIDNPLPVDQNTLFVLGSVTKTYTVTALMCLVTKGLVELDAPVRQYVAELKLVNEQAAQRSPCLTCSTTPLGWTGG